MRTITYVPIVHVPKTEKIKKFEREFKDGNEREACKMSSMLSDLLGECGVWKEISKYLESKSFDVMYCDSQTRWIAERARAPPIEPTGDSLIKIMERVLYKGARAEKTELALLLELTEICLHIPEILGEPAKEILIGLATERGIAGDGKEEQNELEELEGFIAEEDIIDPIRLRDKYIAYQIDRTLRPGENGVLFLGLSHYADRYLIQYEDVLIKKYWHTVYDELRDIFK